METHSMTVRLPFLSFRRLSRRPWSKRSFSLASASLLARRRVPSSSATQRPDPTFSSCTPPLPYPVLGASVGFLRGIMATLPVAVLVGSQIGQVEARQPAFADLGEFTALDEALDGAHAVTQQLGATARGDQAEFSAHQLSLASANGSTKYTSGEHGGLQSESRWLLMAGQKSSWHSCKMNRPGRICVSR